MKSKPRLNHIGIAAANLPGLKKLFSLMGLDIDHVENVPDQGVQTHFIPVPGEVSLELLEPTHPEGVVANYIKKRGAGVHHLSFEVDTGDLEPLTQRLVEQGIRMIYPKPQAGAHGMRVNFIHPSSGCGLLIELMEKKYL